MGVTAEGLHTEGWRRMQETMVRLFSETDGQDLIEYALLAGFISLVSLTWLINLGSTTNGLYGNLNSTVNAIP